MLKNILQKFVTLFASDWIKFIGEPKRGQETDNKHRQAATVADFRKPEDNPIPGNLVLYLHICHVGGEQTATGSLGSDLGYIISGNLSV